ncbi:hypothetical protein Goshw_013503 [Gossypium schwendimanii]|uniref:Uncharacterized protein n=1 Tax=Gossypium schwendimanii TaxID=34291 RepID=A0A7J9MN98_GOSSC|nr:hypothetical protein [Gossypium schwendimanii]
MESVPNQDNTSEFGDIGMIFEELCLEQLAQLSSRHSRSRIPGSPSKFEALNNIFQNHPQFAENFQLKHPEFQNKFLNAIADIHQKLESDLSELGVTEIDDMLLRVRDAEFTGLELSWMKEKLTNSREKILEHETKIKMLEETIRQANLELERLRKGPRLE